MSQLKARHGIAFQISIAIFLLLLLLIIVVPFWRVVMASLTPLNIYTGQGVPFFTPTNSSVGEGL